MACQVCTSAVMTCSFGAAPSVLNVLPINRVLSSCLPSANIMDFIPFVNIPPFGMCMTPSNPAVASATAAAMGVLVPMPCTPITASPWMPGSLTTLVGNLPALNNNSKLICCYGGVISITFPGQINDMVP